MLFVVPKVLANFNDRNSTGILNELPMSALLHYLKLKYAKSFSILKLRCMELTIPFHTETGYFKRNHSPTRTVFPHPLVLLMSLNRVVEKVSRGYS